MIDIDATLLNAHTEREGAAVNYRSGFGFHPMLAYLDETPLVPDDHVVWSILGAVDQMALERVLWGVSGERSGAGGV